MSLHKSDAIILRTAKSGESSLLVHTYLKENGRTNLLAKGVRNPKSKMVGKFGQFAVVELLYYRSDLEKLGVVSQVDTIRNHTELGSHMRRLSYASAVIEILESLTPQDEPNAEIYDLLRHVLYQMNYSHGSKLEFLFLAFLLKLLSISGYHPEFNTCVRTGTDLTNEPEVLFSAADGGVVDRSAADNGGTFYKLDLGTRKVLNLILDSDIDKLNNINFSRNQKDPVKAMLLKFLAVQTDTSPRLSSLEFLDKIKPV